MDRRLAAILAADVIGYSRLMGSTSGGNPKQPVRAPAKSIARPG
jgi:hypothetical protein